MFLLHPNSFFDVISKLLGTSTFFVILEGPSSQHETIELRGFMDDERGDKFVSGKEYSSNETRNSTSNEFARGSVDTPQQGNSREFQEQETETDFSIEKILKMDHIPGLIPVGLQ
jgi:hypothetical protein